MGTKQDALERQANRDSGFSTGIITVGGQATYTPTTPGHTGCSGTVTKIEGDNAWINDAGPLPLRDVRGA